MSGVVVHLRTLILASSSFSVISFIRPSESGIGGPAWGLQSSWIVKVLPALFLFSSLFVSRPSFCVTLTIDKKLVSMSLVSFVASNMRVHFQRCIWSLLNRLKDLSTRSLFGDVMLFSPWNLTDVANLLIATPLSRKIIAACCNFFFTEEQNFCQSLLWGLPCTLFLVLKNHCYICAPLFSAREFSSGQKPRTTYHFLSILSPLC